MLSGQCTIRVSANVSLRFPRSRTSPSFTGVIGIGSWKWSTSAFAPSCEAKTFSGLTASMTVARLPEWSISAWFETM